MTATAMELFLATHAEALEARFSAVGYSPERAAQRKAELAKRKAERAKREAEEKALKSDRSPEEDSGRAMITSDSGHMAAAQRFRANNLSQSIDLRERCYEDRYEAPLPPGVSAAPSEPLLARIREELRRQQEGFSRTLLRMIRERGLLDAEVYRAAGLDKRHFAKIRKNPYYKPRRKTLFALAFALRLERVELDRLMETAGMRLSTSDPFDITIDFCFREHIYDLLLVDQILDHYHLPLLLQHRGDGAPAEH